MNDSTKPLSQTAFSILFALSLKPRHGYELMQQIAQDSSDRIKLGPGALYGTIKLLTEAHLIEEVPFAGERRRYYRLTKRGWDRLGAEMIYYQNIVELGRNRRIVHQEYGALAWLA